MINMNFPFCKNQHSNSEERVEKFDSFQIEDIDFASNITKGGYGQRRFEKEYTGKESPLKDIMRNSSNDSLIYEDENEDSTKVPLVTNLTEDGSENVEMSLREQYLAIRPVLQSIISNMKCTLNVTGGQFSENVINQKDNQAFNLVQFISLLMVLDMLCGESASQTASSKQKDHCQETRKANMCIIKSGYRGFNACGALMAAADVINRSNFEKLKEHRWETQPFSVRYIMSKKRVIVRAVLSLVLIVSIVCAIKLYFDDLIRRCFREQARELSNNEPISNLDWDRF